MPSIKWRKYRSWSGCKISGLNTFILSAEMQNEHLKRALWLTAQVEGGGTFGAINSYDGAAMSAGLEHKIALFPKSMEQGSLWGLLHQMRQSSPCQALENLFDAFKHGPGWVLAEDGKLRSIITGKKISGATIRNEFTPPKGQVPKSGLQWAQASSWALMFHKVFSDEVTYQVQIKSGISSLQSGNRRGEMEAYKASVGTKDLSMLLINDSISIEHDLAWCVYHSFSVNAPAIARRRLVSSAPDRSVSYPARLIRILGTTKYGNWHDSPVRVSRYDRTRKYAIKSNFWPEEFFFGANAIMPKNL